MNTDRKKEAAVPVYEEARHGRGRRSEDINPPRKSPNPLFLIVLAIAGFLAAFTINNLAGQVQKLGDAVSGLAGDKKADAVWKDDMARWREDKDRKDSEQDGKLDAIRQTQAARPFYWEKPNPKTGQN